MVKRNEQTDSTKLFCLVNRLNRKKKISGKISKLEPVSDSQEISSTARLKLLALSASAWSYPGALISHTQQSTNHRNIKTTLCHLLVCQVFVLFTSAVEIPHCPHVEWGVLDVQWLIWWLQICSCVYVLKKRRKLRWWGKRTQTNKWEKNPKPQNKWLWDERMV